MDIWLKAINQYWPELFLFQFAVVGYELLYILYKRVKAYMPRQKLETLEKVKARKARKKMRARKAGKKLIHLRSKDTQAREHVSHVGTGVT